MEGERLVVTEGYGITPLGDEIYIPPGTEWPDFRACLESRCGMGGGGGCDDPEGTASPRPGEGAPPDDASVLRAWVVARPHTRVTGHAPSFPDDCGHPGNHTRVNRVCETFRLDIVCDLVAPHAPDPLPCSGVQALVCWGTSGGPAGSVYPVALPPPQVEDELNYLVLAELQVEAGEVRGVSQAVRRRLLPVELLQRRLECLCQTPPVTTSPPSTTTPPTTTPPPTTAPPTTTRPPVGTATLIPYTTPPIGTFTLIPYTTLPPIITTLIPFTTGFQVTTRIVGPGGAVVTGGLLDPIGAVTRPVDENLLGGGGRIVVVNEPVGGGLGGVLGGGPGGGLAGGGIPVGGGVVGPGLETPGGTPVSGLDPRVFEVGAAETRSIEALDFLDASQIETLRDAGITSVRGLLETENSRLIEVLDSSEVGVAELKVGATESLRRSQPLDLDQAVFDVARGAAESVDAVSGIGPARARALGEGGIRSVAELAAADPTQVGDLLGLSSSVAQGMIDDARSRMTR